jgi:hypothetical protein
MEDHARGGGRITRRNEHWISARRRIGPARKEPNSLISEETFDIPPSREIMTSNQTVQTFVPLVLRLESLLDTLEREIELAADN